MPREIIVDWTGPGSGGKVTVTYWDAAPDVGDQRAALGDFLSAVDALLDNAVGWSIRSVGRELANSTGTLTGEWTDSAPHTGTGALPGQACPDASQVLFRWTTGVVVAGRFLKGRTFIPGLEVGNVTDGNLSTTAISGFTSAAVGLAASGVGFSVWHRPVSGAGGSLHPVEGGSVWQELAVLRGRRG